MKRMLCAGMLGLLFACNNAGGDDESNARAPDTVVIDADSVKDARIDGTEIDAMVLDTTIR